MPFITEFMVMSLIKMRKMALRENQGFCFKYIEFKMLISQSTGEMKLVGMIEPGVQRMDLLEMKSELMA